MVVMKSKTNRQRMMEIPAIGAILAISIAGLINLNTASQRVTVGLLLASFTVVLFLPWPKGHQPLFNHVRLVVLTALAAGLMSFQSGWNFYPILFFILAPIAMMNLPIRASLVWIGIFTLVTGVIFYAVNGLSGLVILLPFAAGYIFFGIFGWTMIDAERSRDRSDALLAELQTAHQQLQDYAARVEELTIAQERNRIAREMHDTLGHRLTIASVQLEGAQRLIPSNPERAAQIIGTVREQVKEGLTDLRRTVAMLRAPVEEDLPLSQALNRLVDQVHQATSLKIHLSLEGCPADLPLPLHQAFYRAVQEGLTNIQRHARASEAWLQLAQMEGDSRTAGKVGLESMVELLISDNGIGMSPEQIQTGYGLVGLKERAAILGGEFHIDPRQGGGTTITFCVPLASEPKSQQLAEPPEGMRE